MYDWNGSIRSLNVGLPDDIARLKAAGYYQEAIARIDRLLAEDWTKTQNGPASIVGHIPMIIMPGWKPGWMANGTSWVLANPNRY